jgi:acyl-CoA thioesterase-1
MGDSLSAGYGIHVENGWVALLAKRLAAQGYEYQVVNASVTGETSGGGKVRLQSLLSTHKPAIVILELGANDGLRGLPVKQMRDNLASMIEAAQAASAKVLVIGMQIPPNYGQQYTTSFSDTYTELAKTYHLKLVPFLLDGVALDAKQMQADNLHPNELGQPRLLDNVWPALQSMLTPKPSNSRRAMVWTPPI